MELHILWLDLLAYLGGVVEKPIDIRRLASAEGAYYSLVELCHYGQTFLVGHLHVRIKVLQKAGLGARHGVLKGQRRKLIIYTPYTWTPGADQEFFGGGGGGSGPEFFKGGGRG